MCFPLKKKKEGEGLWGGGGERWLDGRLGKMNNRGAGEKMNMDKIVSNRAICLKQGLFFTSVYVHNNTPEMLRRKNSCQIKLREHMVLILDGSSEHVAQA